MRGLLTALIVLGTAHAQERLVVLEVETATEVSAELRHTWTDAIRRVAHTRLGDQVQVLRRLDVDALLAPNVSVTLADCDTDCAVSVGRQLGVDLVVTARLYQQDAIWRARVALSRTQDGRLLGHATGLAAQVVTALEAATHDALETLNPADSPQGEVLRAQPVDAPGPPGLMITGPHPMQIRVNGAAIGTSPLRIPTTQRFVTIHASADGYQSQEFIVDAGPISSTIALELEPTSGVVHLKLPKKANDTELWVNGKRIPFVETLRLASGGHRLKLADPCFEFDEMQVEVRPGSEETVKPGWRWRCPRLKLNAKRRVDVQIDGRWYVAPTTTARVMPGEYTMRIGRPRQRTQSLTVRPSAHELQVEIPTKPLDFGADLGYVYRRHLGGMAFLRFWNHAQSKQKIRWGGHMGIGVGIEDNPDFVPGESERYDRFLMVGGLFIGASIGVPITSWLEWTSMGEFALGGASKGAPGILGAQSGLRIKWGHLAFEGGWGVAAHGLVDGWHDAHGFRLGIVLTER